MKQLISGGTELSLSRGSVFSKVVKRKSEHFRVRTPTAVAGVRGTQFFVAIDKGIRTKSEEVMLCVNEGSVNVQSTENKGSVLLNEGEGIVISAVDKKIPKGEKLPWIKKFNWNMDEKSGKVDDTTSLKEAYKAGYQDLLNQDYD